MKTTIVDSNGTEVVQYVYDAWGNHKISGSNTTLGNLNPFRYRSYFYDTESKLYYLKTRYYDPEVGRFINMDGIQYADPETINGLNLYAYCGNNPVNYVDPDGNAKWWQWALLGLGVAGVVAAGVVATVASGGTALLAGTAAIAGSLGGLGSIAYQGITNGWDKIDTGAIGASMLLCSAAGALGYGGSTLLGGSFGAFALAGGGTVSIGATALTAGLLGLGIVFSKGADRYKPKDSRGNYAQNKEFEYLVEKYNLNKEQQRRLHDKITKRGFGREKILEVMKVLFPYLF